MKTVYDVAETVSRKVEAIIIAYYPKPSCSSKHLQWQADITRIKKMVADRLGGAGITINVDVS